jgi:hypothetical protein
MRHSRRIWWSGPQANETIPAAGGITNAPDRNIHL